MKAWLAATLAVATLSAHAGREPAFFFDDFSYADTTAMFQQGWTARSAAGHPGLPGARWAPEALSLVDGKLRLRGTTDGTGAGTTQVQVCHQRKYLAGTYAARVRFSDSPVSGADGDPVIQTFYVVSPLKHDFDPENGQWGALQLLARYAVLTVDRDAFDLGLAAVSASREARQITVGANWYPTAFVKFYATYERTTFHDGAARPSEHVILFRSQLAFGDRR